MEDRVERLIKISETNQSLLAQIATNQEELLEIEHHRRNIERNKLYFEIGKLIFWAIMIYVSFILTTKLTQNLMENFVGSVSDVTQSQSVEEALNTPLLGNINSDLMRELLGK